MQETQVQSLGQEDLLKEEKATHSSVLAWKNPMDRGAWQAAARRVAERWTWLSMHACRETGTNERDGRNQDVAESLDEKATCQEHASQHWE